MNLETLLRLHNDLVSFDDSKPIVVTYHQNSLLFRQSHKIVVTPYIDNYYFHSKLKLGVLLPKDYFELLTTLRLMIQDPGIKEAELNTGLRKLGFDVYGLQPGLVGPQIKYEINFVSITRSWLAKLALKRAGTDSRLLLKVIENEKRKSRKSIKDTTTT